MKTTFAEVKAIEYQQVNLRIHVNFKEARGHVVQNGVEGESAALRGHIHALEAECQFLRQQVQTHTTGHFCWKGSNVSRNSVPGGHNRG